MVLELLIKALVSALVDMLAGLLTKLILEICSILLTGLRQTSCADTVKNISCAC